MNKSLFSALWLEKMAISITIGLIVMVAALNIAASLVLLVMEKNRDIAILKTMGTLGEEHQAHLRPAGAGDRVLGTTAGAMFGYAIIYVLDRYKLIHVPIDVYQIRTCRSSCSRSTSPSSSLAALAICFVATIYPSRQASKLDPAQALRYQ